MPSGTVLPRDDACPSSLGLAYTGPARQAEPSGTDLPRDPCPGPSTSLAEAGSLGHDPKRAPTLARLERLVGHSDSSVSPGEASPAAAESFRETPFPSACRRDGGSLGPVDAEKLRAKLDTALAAVEVGPVQVLGGARASGAPRDARRTRSETRLAFRESEGDGLDDRRFTALDVTSGLPDDSRDADQRARAWVEAQRRGRVCAALAALEAHPEAREQVFRDQTKLRLFCARFSITPSDICPMSESVTERCSWCRGRHGVFTPVHVDDVSEVLTSPCDYLAEVRAREAAVLPSSEA